MDFDASTAEPVTVQSGFDPSTAQPVARILSPSEVADRVDKNMGEDLNAVEPGAVPKVPERLSVYRDLTKSFISLPRLRKNPEQATTLPDIGPTGDFLPEAEQKVATAQKEAVQDVSDSENITRENDRRLAKLTLGATDIPMVRGVINSAMGIIEGIVSPIGALTTPAVRGPAAIAEGAIAKNAPTALASPVVQRTVAGVFAADMTRHAIENAPEVMKVLRDPNTSDQQKAEVVSGELANLAFASLAGKHAATGGPHPTDITPEKIRETIKPDVGETEVPTPEITPSESFDVSTAEPVKPPVDRVADYQRYQEIQSELHDMVAKASETGKSMESPEFQKLWQENEDIKNRNPDNPGMPPSPPEVEIPAFDESTAMLVTSDGEIGLKPIPSSATISPLEPGQIGHEVVIPGKPGGEPRFPGSTEVKPEFQGSIEEAKAAGYDVDSMLKAAPKPEEIAPEEEPPETYGIAARVSKARAEAGKIEPIEPGEGVSAPDIIQHGRDLIEAGEDPIAAAARVKETGKADSEDVALLRAHGEDLAQIADRAEKEFGSDSPEYKAAAKADHAWQQNVIQPLRTEWHKSGQAMQGETDIDTGSFHGLARAVQDLTGKELNPKQAKEAKAISEETSKLTEEVEGLKKRVSDLLKTKVERLPKTKGLGLSEYFRTPATEARIRLQKRLSGEITSSSVLLGLESVPDLAIIAAEHMARGIDAAAELVKEFGDQVKPHLDAVLAEARKQIDAAQEEKSQAALEKKKKALETRIAALKEKIDSGDISTPGKKANRPSNTPIEELEQERDDLSNQLGAMRRSATKIKDLEKAIKEKQRKLDEGDLSTEGVAKNRPSIEPIEKLQQQRDDLNKQLAEARKEAAKPSAEEEIQANVDAINKQIELRKEKLRTGDLEPEPRELNRPQPEPIEKAKQELEDVNRQIAEARKQIPENEEENVSKDVWQRAKDLLDSGEDDYSTIVNKIATDTGLSEAEVHAKLAEPKSVRKVTDEMYAKMAKRRAIVNQAKDWIKNQQTPGIIKALKVVPNAMFRVATALHGTVFGVTHAAINIFNPTEWATYWPNFIRQFKLMGLHDRGAYHERMMQQLERDPNFIFAKRAGLNNDPHRFTDDIQSVWNTKYLREIGQMGNRGADAIKLMRQAMFNNAWEKYSPELRTLDDAKLLADAVNHATGSIRTRFPEWSNWAFFAARLEASRWAWMLKDPAKAGEIMTRWSTGKPTTYGERMFAMRELKQKATIAGTYLGLLAANQGLLTYSDSKQKINFTDPSKADFLAFKAAGHQVSPISPMLGMVRLFSNLLHISMGTRSRYEQMQPKGKEIGGLLYQYVRGKLSPSLGVGVDIATQADLFNRPLPFSKERVPASVRRQGEGKYTYTEYALTHFLPLFAEEAVREVWKKQGMNEEQIDHWIAGLATAALMGSTGFRVTEDKKVQRDSVTLPPPPGVK